MNNNTNKGERSETGEYENLKAEVNRILKSLWGGNVTNKIDEYKSVWITSSLENDPALGILLKKIYNSQVEPISTQEITKWIINYRFCGRRFELECNNANNLSLEDALQSQKMYRIKKLKKYPICLSLLGGGYGGFNLPEINVNYDELEGKGATQLIHDPYENCLRLMPYEEMKRKGLIPQRRLGDISLDKILARYQIASKLLEDLPKGSGLLVPVPIGFSEYTKGDCKGSTAAISIVRGSSVERIGHIIEDIDPRKTPPNIIRNLGKAIAYLVNQLYKCKIYHKSCTSAQFSLINKKEVLNQGKKPLSTMFDLEEVEFISDSKKLLALNIENLLQFIFNIDGALYRKRHNESIKEVMETGVMSSESEMRETSNNELLLMYYLYSSIFSEYLSLNNYKKSSGNEITEVSQIKNLEEAITKNQYRVNNLFNGKPKSFTLKEMEVNIPDALTGMMLYNIRLSYDCEPKKDLIEKFEANLKKIQKILVEIILE